MDTPSNNPQRVRDDVLSPVAQDAYHRMVAALDAREYARQAGSETRLLGVMFALVGTLLLVFQWRPRVMLASQLLVIANTAALVGPGVWYIFAARYIQRGRLWVLPVTYKVALGQGAVIAFLLLLGEQIGLARRGSEFIVPAILAVYFCPALIVLCFRLRRLSGLAPLLADDQGRAFEPLRVQPVHDPAGQKGGSHGTAARG